MKSFQEDAAGYAQTAADRERYAELTRRIKIAIRNNDFKTAHRLQVALEQLKSRHRGMAPAQEDVNKIIRHILEHDLPAAVRACAKCEQEHGILNRADPCKSHGLCRRHMIQFAREGGLSDADVEDIVGSTSSWPPDLGPISTRT